MKNLMTTSLNKIVENNVSLPVCLKMSLENKFDFGDVDKDKEIPIIDLVRIVGTQYISYLLDANSNNKLKSLFVCDAIDVLKLNYKKEGLENYEFLKECVSKLKNIIINENSCFDKLDELYQIIEEEYYKIHREVNPISKEVLFCFLLAIQYVKFPNYKDGNNKSKMALDRICRNFYENFEGTCSRDTLISLLKRNSQYQD